MVDYILYDGIGANKNGKHSLKEFVALMNKHHKVGCSVFYSDVLSTYKPCVELREMNRKKEEYERKHNIPLFTSKRSKKNQEKYSQLQYKCYGKTKKQIKAAQKRTRKHKCNLKQYVDYSLAKMIPSKTK